MQIPLLSYLQVLIGLSTMPWGYDINAVQVLTVQGGRLPGGGDDRRRTGR